MAAKPIIAIEVPRLKVCFLGGPLSSVSFEPPEPDAYVESVIKERLQRWAVNNGPDGYYMCGEPQMSGHVAVVYSQWQEGTPPRNICDPKFYPPEGEGKWLHSLMPPAKSKGVDS